MLNPLKQPARAHLPNEFFPTSSDSKTGFGSQLERGRDEPIRDLELHAEGHFQRRLLTVRCFGRQLLTPGDNLFYQLRMSYLQFFSYSLGQILEGTWKILPLSRSPERTVLEWCQRLAGCGKSLVLGGAALQRCDKDAASIGGF